MERETKSLKVNPVLWKNIKEYCVREDISISSYIEGLIKKDLNLKKEVKNNGN